MPKNWEFLKKAERDILCRLLGVLVIMLVYWGILLYGVHWDPDDSALRFGLYFFLPLPFVFLLFYYGFQPHPFRRGMRLYRKGRHAEAAKSLGEAMHGLHVGGAVMLGGMYLEGKGVRKDPDLGVEACRKALGNYYFIRTLLPEYVKAGDIPPRFARLVMLGQTVESAGEWLASAVPSLERAAAEGNVAAMVLLRDMYGLKSFSLADSDKSVAYARMAAERDGGGESEAALGMRLINGAQTTREDTEEGLRILDRCFRRGDLYAGWFLSLLYADGDNPYVPRDWGRAVAYFEDLLDSGEIGAEDPEKTRVYVETFNDLAYAKGKTSLLSPAIKARVNALLDRSE